MESLKSNLTENQQKSVDWMMFLVERAALYLDFEETDKAASYTKALDETVESLAEQGLNPLSIALEQIKK